MRFYLVSVSSRGYGLQGAFEADTVAEACRKHIAAYKAKRFHFALVMRDANGKRYSFENSSALVINEARNHG